MSEPKHTCEVRFCEGYAEGGMAEFFRAREAWSEHTFGPRSVRGGLGPLRHLRKELLEEILPELEDKDGEPIGVSERRITPSELLEEFVDVQFLLHDAVSREGFSYEEFLAMCWKKLAKNRARAWGPNSADGITEHVRE